MFSFLSLTQLAYAKLNYSSRCYLPVTTLCCSSRVTQDPLHSSAPLFLIVRVLHNGGTFRSQTGGSIVKQVFPREGERKDVHQHAISVMVMTLSLNMLTQHFISQYKTPQYSLDKIARLLYVSPQVCFYSLLMHFTFSGKDKIF